MRAARAVIVAAAAAGWACWLVAAPALAAGSPPRAAVWASALAYRAGAVICHQQDARSLHVGGVRMPVCARCFGLYGGGAAGALLAAGWVLSARRALSLTLARWRWAAVLCGLPTFAAWGGEHLAGLAVPGAERALLAVPLGAVVAAIVTLWAGGAAFDDTPAVSALHS
ncbi:MAG: DUF2085 domain-containing protein [Vicinamibacterales bacterium]